MKRFVLSLLMLALVLPAAFVGGARESETGPIVINYWTHEDPNRTALENRLISEFEADNPDVKINRVTHSSTRIQELILTAFAANQGPDIFNMSIEDEYAYIGQQASCSRKCTGSRVCQ